MTNIFRDIRSERERQESLRASGKFTHTCATPGITDDACMRVLAEEVDETLDHADDLRRSFGVLVRGMNDRHGNAANVASASAAVDLRSELIQVAAVAVAWIERIDAKSVSSIL